MKVILIQTVSNLGRKGDVKEVTVGYGLNFLIPKKLAIEATTAEIEKLKKKIELKNTEKEKQEKELKEIIEKIKGLKLEIEERADEKGTLYGGVDKKKIAELLKNKGFNIDPEKIHLFSHLKKIGEQEVEIQLLPELKIKIIINIKASA